MESYEKNIEFFETNNFFSPGNSLIFYKKKCHFSWRAWVRMKYVILFSNILKFIRNCISIFVLIYITQFFQFTIVIIEWIMQDSPSYSWKAKFIRQIWTEIIDSLKTDEKWLKVKIFSKIWGFHKRNSFFSSTIIVHWKIFGCLRSPRESMELKKCEEHRF